jgi:AAA+ superfamily predicted ATPase
VHEALIASLQRAVEASPDDLPLRMHLAELLLETGERAQAIAVLAAALQRAPLDAAAGAAMVRALRPEGAAPAAGLAVGAPPPEPDPGAPGRFDWRAAEQELSPLEGPSFPPQGAVPPGAVPPSRERYEVERTGLTLDDVGGMQGVKDRLNAAFLAPLKNPELRALYGKSLRGGLLMYGPPGCGKTHLARALAGELDATFLAVGIADILDPMLGTSETNVHEAFQLARRCAPCVLFLDEIDTLGQRRSALGASSLRGVVNQLLLELDGVDVDNEGVFLLAATNQPWDVDPALRRPGRLDRTVVVLPPDGEARAAIFRRHLEGRPVTGVDVAALAAATEGFSGADIAHVCESAAERALLDSIRTGRTRPITGADLDAARKEIRPSTTGWLESARNMVAFGEDDGTYAELRGYLKRSRRW